MTVITPTIFTLVYAGLCLLVFALVYERWMHRESFFQANRFYLLIVPLVAFLIPHLQIEVNVGSRHSPAIMILEQTRQLPAEWLRLFAPQPKAWAISWGTLLLALYAIGVAFSLGRSLWNYLKICYWIRSGKVQSMGEWHLVHQENIPEAASFFNYVFWKNQQPIPPMVLQHELIHVQQGHSWDVLLMEIWIALYWFNPLVYRMRQRLQETHEFIADAGVIEAQGSKYAYACLLASQKQKLEQMPYNTFAAQLNTRLRRMAQAGSPQWRAIQYALCLPLMLSMTLFFSVNYLQALPLPATELNLGESIEALEKTPVLKLAEVPSTPTTQTERTSAIAKLPTLAPDTVPVQSTITINSGEGVKINMNSSLDAGQNNVIHLKSTSNPNGPGNPLIIIDGKNMGKMTNTGDSPLAKLDPKEINSISVLKGESATTIYGEEGNNGVIIVHTKAYKGENEIKPNTVNPSKQSENFDLKINGKPTENYTIRVNGDVTSGNVEKVNIDASQTPKGSVRVRSNVNGRPLIVKDGKVLGRLHQYESDQPLKGIDPNTIKAIKILKGKDATDKYGKDAEDGVIEVESKQ